MDLEQKIKAGTVIPSLRLPDARGGIVDRQKYRQHASLAIVFLPDLGPASQRYLRELSASAARWARDEKALAVLPASPDELSALGQELELPLLADVEGQARAQFLPEGARGGWFATDRWGELYAQGAAQSALDLPPPDELRGWLDFIGCECGG